jgi:L-asparaginase
MALPKVAFIGTGGTIASLGVDGLDIIHYGDNKTMLPADQIIAQVPEVAQVADVIPVPFATVGSPDIFFPQWKAISKLADDLVAEHPDLAGIVVGHGTASLEETAYALSLGIGVEVPVVVVGSQRPLSGLGSDAGHNLVNGIRAAAAPQSRGRGVLTLLNDEIHSAREVTKTATTRLQTFTTRDFGMLGHVDGPYLHYYRKSERKAGAETEFHLSQIEDFPRVDIAYAYTGADAAAIDAFVAAGAKGIVVAGFAPGGVTAAMRAALEKAVANGVPVVLSTRAGSGVVHPGGASRAAGFLSADNLIPQKARILLSYALTTTSDTAEIVRIFATY